MDLKLNLNNFFAREIYNSNNSSSAVAWWWWFLFATVIIAIIFCIVVTAVVLEKTKRKVKEFQEKEALKFNGDCQEQSEIIQKKDTSKSFNSNTGNKNFNSILLNLLNNLENQAKKTNTLSLQLDKIPKMDIEIEKYLRKNKIETINDLLNFQKSLKNQLPSDLPGSKYDSLDFKKKNFTNFINTIQEFIEEEKEK